MNSYRLTPMEEPSNGMNGHHTTSINDSIEPSEYDNCPWHNNRDLTKRMQKIYLKN